MGDHTGPIPPIGFDVPPGAGPGAPVLRFRSVRIALAIWMIVQGLCWTFAGASVVIVFWGVGSFNRHGGAMALAGLAVVAPVLMIGAVDFLAGVGFLRGRSWAAPLAMIGLIVGALLAGWMAQVPRFRGGGYAVAALDLLTIAFVALLPRKASRRTVASEAVPAFRRWPPD